MGYSQNILPQSSQFRCSLELNLKGKSINRFVVCERGRDQESVIEKKGDLERERERDKKKKDR